MVNKKAVATIKNIAGYEMDFTATEIIQRFNRGDKSRTTEGSGLGLSIAESFTKVCNGTFQVDIDGDMFKVTICFDMVK
jgi:signal transduction histidine kinase